jgi:hypothetical protein
MVWFMRTRSTVPAGTEGSVAGAGCGWAEADGRAAALLADEAGCAGAAAVLADWAEGAGIVFAGCACCGAACAFWSGAAGCAAAVGFSGLGLFDLLHPAASSNVSNAMAEAFFIHFLLTG